MAGGRDHGNPRAVKSRLCDRVPGVRLLSRGSLSEEDAGNFYGNRVKLLKDWLAEEGTAELFSDEEKEFLIRRYEELKTPFIIII